jgi:hypothetical protein
MKLILNIALLLSFGCANTQSYNQSTTGRVLLKGGVFKKEQWDDTLTFKRMSWYHGMTLYFDTLLYRASPASPFSKWFSPSEMEYFQKCESLLVTVSYSSDPAKISHVNFREQMKLNGYDDVVLNSFASYLKVHPSAVDWRLTNYKVLGYCKRAPTRMDSQALGINFPSFGYLEVDI